jgi:hypothetical protein
MALPCRALFSTFFTVATLKPTPCDRDDSFRRHRVCEGGRPSFDCDDFDLTMVDKGHGLEWPALLDRLSDEFALFNLQRMKP